jgi:hypothetical protein
MFSLVELAAPQSLKELISDWRKRQSYGELKTLKFLRSSAKIKHLQRLHRSLINMLKRKGPRTEPCGTPEVT